VTLEIDSKDDSRPVTTADLRVSLDGFEHEPDRLDVEIPSAETAEEMADAIRRFAFPALQEALDTDPDIASEGSISPEKLKEALLKDLDPLIQHSWRAHSRVRRNGPEAELMKTLGFSIPPQLMEDPAEQGASPDNDDDDNQ
jgi:hypothetical protein